MLSVEENELLTRTNAGTPMGELMRRYWQPVAAAAELDDNPFHTKEVTIMGEELVLYRDRSGQLGLLDRYCTHRRASLAYGITEDDGIRCQYHGWKFDAAGAVIDQPFEDTTHPDQRFRAKCDVTAYKAKELGGLVFAYLGPEPAPELPNWGPLVWDDCVHDIAISELPCNWLQCQENSLDPVHNEWLHRYYTEYVNQISDGKEPSFKRLMEHEKIGFDLFDYGIIKRRVTKGYTEDDDDWKEGHPILFPNILLVGSQFSCTLQFRVPLNDTTCYHVSYYTWRAAPGKKAPVQETVPYRYTQLKGSDGKYLVDLTFNQDYMAWITQGPIAKRHLEKLGESDRGVIMFRKLLRDQMSIMETGGDPMCTFRDPAQNVCIEPPLEHIKFGQKAPPAKYRPGEAGYSRDAGLIEATMATWGLPEKELARA